MPTRQLKRAWCKKCNDWELFEQPNFSSEDWICKTCESKHESILISEIPIEKVLEQRARYTKNKKEQLFRIFNNYANPVESFLHEMMPEPGSDIHITEADAGQHAIDEKERKIKEKEKILQAEKREAAKEEIRKYNSINRNDICLCGSGKKYKKCECFKRIQEIERKYRF